MTTKPAFCAPVPLSRRFVGNTSRLRCTPTARHGDDLLVIGAGGLGLRVARRWRQRYPGAPITCATSTEARHEQLADEGFTPMLASELRESASSVLFCAPANYDVDADEYSAAVAQGASLARSRFVFTSSTTVYNTSPLVITENGELSTSERARLLLDAEHAAGEKGIVLRLGGLYELLRGAHLWWLKSGKVREGANSVVSLVHYDDAAVAAMQALTLEELEGGPFVIVDGNATTRRELVEAARLHPFFQRMQSPTFGSGEPCKFIDNSWTREKLQWQPRWKSMQHYFGTAAVEMAAARDLGVM